MASWWVNWTPDVRGSDTFEYWLWFWVMTLKAVLLRLKSRSDAKA